LSKLLGTSGDLPALRHARLIGDALRRRQDCNITKVYTLWQPIVEFMLLERGEKNGLIVNTVTSVPVSRDARCGEKHSLPPPAGLQRLLDVQGSVLRRAVK